MDDKLDKVLDKWLEVKASIKKLQIAEERLKEYIMDKLTDKSSLYTSRYKVKKNTIKKNIISRANVPTEVWEKYSKSITYNTISVNEYNTNEDELFKK